MITDDYNVASPILEANSYYPFGLQQKGIGLTQQTNPLHNKYTYNGKELQEDLGLDQYDYGARFQDPQLGMWHNLDPSADKHPDFTPYNYAFNNPMLVTDPDGKDGIVTGSGTKDDPYVIKANYYYYGLNQDQTSGLNDAIKDYNNGGKSTEIKTKSGSLYVIYDLSATEVKDADEATSKANGDYTKDGNHVYFYGNTVTSGSTSKDDTLGEATNTRQIVPDGSKVTSLHDNAPGVSLTAIYTGDVTHEIGHNLGGSHGDPGSIMINVNTAEQQRSNRLGNSGTGIYNYTLPRVDKNGTRAIIGRMNMPKGSPGSINSLYMSDKETKRANSNPTAGTVGEIHHQ